MATSPAPTTGLLFQVTDICARETLQKYPGAYDARVMREEYPYLSGGSAVPSSIPKKDDDDDADADPFDWSRNGDDDNTHNEPPKKKSTSYGDPRATTVICLFGKTSEGQNVLARVKYKPFVFVEIPDKWKKSEIGNLIKDMARSVRLDESDLLYTVEKRKRAYGWIPREGSGGSETKKWTVLRIRFPNEKVMRIASVILAKKGQRDVFVYERENKFSTVHKFCDDLGIVHNGWIEIPNSSMANLNDFAGHADIEVEVADYHQVQFRVDLKDLSPLIVASVDIECRSEKGGFPDASNANDFIVGIGTSLKRYGTPGYEHHYFALRETKLPKIRVSQALLHIHWYPTEREMLFAWRDWLIGVNPDVLVGYNVNGFDFKYIADRVNQFIYNQASRLFYLSKLWGEHTPLISPEFSSNAYGERQFYTFNLPGRLVLDMLEIIRREHKLRSYKLDAVAKYFLKCRACDGKSGGSVACQECHGTGKMAKIDLPHQQIWSRFEGDAEDRGVIAEYCSMDCELVLELMGKLCTLQNIMEMSKVTLTPMQDIVSRGQQIKVLNQIIWYAHRDEFVVNNHEDVKPDKEGYEGARVLDPHPGFYMDPITVLDFESLYPSIMRQHNLCFSTWVKNPEYLELPNAKYLHVDTGAREYDFIQHLPGILPKILTTLLTARKGVKKEMEAEKDPLRKSLLNGRQLALKISANSIYGFCGVGLKGVYPCLPVADTTTYFGREMILRLKNAIEKEYAGTDVIYGDSVSADTPILCRWQGQIFYRTIDDLPIDGAWSLLSREKEMAYPKSGFQVWSDTGFTDLQRIMRHRTRKDLIRVLTHTGYVTATEDHSLLTPDGSTVRPSETGVGIPLMHRDLPWRVSAGADGIHCPYSKGLFYGDGSCGSYDWGTKHSWAINNQNLKYLNDAKLELESYYKDFTFKILDTVESSGVYKLIPHGRVKDIVVEWKDLFYGKRKVKKVPDEILQSSESDRKTFLRGIEDCANSDGNDRGYIRMNSEGQIGAAGLYFLLSSLGYPVSLDICDGTGPEMYELTATKEVTLARDTFERNQVKKLVHIGPTFNFVYDLETASHHFGAGIGRLIVHNTDSVMVKFPLSGHPTPVEESFRLGTAVTEMAHTMFGGVIKLAMEKVFHGYILLKKKRYAGLTYTDPKKPPEIKMSGVEAVRRDSAIMVSSTYESVVRALLLDRSVQKAVQIVQKKLDELVQNRVPFEEYVLSCQLKKKYKNPNQAQLIVTNKIRERAPGSEPKSGDRVQYVIIQAGKKNGPVYKKVEEAAYAQDHKIPLDRLHYLDHQLFRPLSDLLEAFVPDPAEIFSKPRALLTNQREKLQDIRKFLKPVASATPVPVPESAVSVPEASTPEVKPDLFSFKRKRVGKNQKDPRQPTLRRT